jgi:spermidine synthase
MKREGILNSISLGVCSLATQAIFLRLVLSSGSGGELYTAMALACWLGWVGIGSLIGRTVNKSFQSKAWIIQGLIKLPIAFIIIIYPRLFIEILDPFKYAPLLLIGMAGPGLLYGLLFALLITPENKTSTIYKFEALGALLGGIIVTMWAYWGLGNFSLMIPLAIYELSIGIGYRKLLWISIPLGIYIGLNLGHTLDEYSAAKRWTVNKVYQLSYGFSGSWLTLIGGDQVTVIHNGIRVASNSDREEDEEALLWPLLFKPKSRLMLLIGFEGMEVARYLPKSVQALRLFEDEAYLKLGLFDLSKYKIAEPLAYESDQKFDIISVQLHGAATLADYKFETESFFFHCKSMLTSDGILYISTISDENYIGPELGKYLSSLICTLKRVYGDIQVIPGSRIGFICSAKGIMKHDLTTINSSLQALSLNSPYFNYPLVINKMASIKQTNFMAAIDTTSGSNSILKPSSVLHFLRWQGEEFGFSGKVFSIYKPVFLMFGLIMLLILPLFLAYQFHINLPFMLGSSCLGFLGMAFEILILYLFQILFGSLYLHIGLIMAAFMAGLSGGAAIKVNYLKFINVISLISTCTLALILPLILNSQIGLHEVEIILYIIAVTIGIATGSGFSQLAQSQDQSVEFGAILYASDLTGAVLAAILTPGLLIWLGTFPLILILTVVSLISWVSLGFAK